MTYLSPAVALARSTTNQLTRHNGPSLPWSLYSEPRCIQSPPIYHFVCSTA